MTKTVFRPTGSEEAGAVAELLTRVFELPASACVTDRAHLNWKNWQDRPDWSGSRGYVLSRGQDLIAHGTVLPLPCVVEGRRLRLAHVIDWAADPNVVGAGVSHMRKFTTMVDGIVAAGGSDLAQKALPAMGFTSFDTLTRFSLPIHPLKRLAGQQPGRRLLLQFGRSVLWSMQARRASFEGWTAELVSPDQVSSAQFPVAAGLPGMAVFEHSRESLAYLTRCPVVRVEVYQVSRSDAAQGYFVLSHAPGQVRLADCWLHSTNTADWQAVLQLAVDVARRDTSAAEIVTEANDELMKQSLTALGFHPRGEYPIRMLLARGVEFPAVPIRWQMINYDVVWLHEHKPEFWA